MAEGGWRRAIAGAHSDCSVLAALQYFARFKNGFHGLIDKSIYALDRSAHSDNVYEAVVQHVVNVVG